MIKIYEDYQHWKLFRKSSGGSRETRLLIDDMGSKHFLNYEIDVY